MVAFHVEAGDAERSVLLLVHGLSTCSVGWVDLVELLEGRHRVCALDLPGCGFSEKPVGWGCSLVRDAELLDHHVREVIGAEALVVLATGGRAWPSTTCPVPVLARTAHLSR